MSADLRYPSDLRYPDIAATPAWQALSRHHDEIGATDLRELFDEDPARGTRAGADRR